MSRSVFHQRGRAPRAAMAILLAAGVFAQVPAPAGTTGPSFLNWDVNFGNNNSGNQVNNVQINLGPNNGTISQTILYDNGKPVPGFAGATASNHGGNLVLTWPVPPSANIPASGKGLHVGVGFNGGMVGNPGHLIDDPGTLGISANVSNPTTGAGQTIGNMPVLNPSVSTQGGSPTNFHPAVVTFTAAANGMSVAEWWEMLLPVGASLTFTFTNPDPDDLGSMATLGTGREAPQGADGDDFPVVMPFGAGIMFPSQLIPLDELNPSLTLPVYPLLPDGTVVPAEGSVTGQMVAEPSTLVIALSGIGALGLIRFARVRRQAGA